ncbi:MAG: hypothetical protein IKU86_04095 [Thermoguttaceae bacterium]|nr:hypothetical protein [Thermoguttaceae bacterium]
MREIGGYIEWEKYAGPMLREDAVALNCGRNALAYLLRARKIRKIWLPKFLCASVRDVCVKEGVEVAYYSVDSNFEPIFDVELGADEYFYLVNYYGQIELKKIKNLADKYARVVVDNAQAYFQPPIAGVDTLYTCRKFFGVADGAFLYTEAELDEELPLDESFDRTRFLLGRFERTASEFYAEYVANNKRFADEPIKRTSKLTLNLLRAVDYEKTATRRTENFQTLDAAFGTINRLALRVPEGPFAYPLWLENGSEVRQALQTKKIYVPTLWPDVFNVCDETELEYDMAKNILPLPIDQRYVKEDMERLIEETMKTLS